jgi:hypothetical protein
MIMTSIHPALAILLMFIAWITGMIIGAALMTGL